VALPSSEKGYFQSYLPRQTTVFSIGPSFDTAARDGVGYDCFYYSLKVETVFSSSTICILILPQIRVKHTTV